MKINISGLMSLISEYEKKSHNLLTVIRTTLYNVSTIELDGTTNVIEDNNKEFNESLNEYNSLLDKVTKLKSILYEKNNSFKLSDGRTIQEAIIDNTNLRQVKNNYEYLLGFNSVKKRVTEVNNSYFEAKTINYDKDRVKKELENITDKIQKTDFEISKLNSIEFDIDL